MPRALILAQCIGLQGCARDLFACGWRG